MHFVCPRSASGLPQDEAMARMVRAEPAVHASTPKVSSVGALWPTKLDNNGPDGLREAMGGLFLKLSRLVTPDTPQAAPKMAAWHSMVPRARSFEPKTCQRPHKKGFSLLSRSRGAVRRPGLSRSRSLRAFAVADLSPPLKRSKL